MFLFEYNLQTNNSPVTDSNSYAVGESGMWYV